MPKLLLDVILKPIPNKDDVLVYDEKQKCFVEISKEDFLKEPYQKIGELEETVKKLNAKIDKLGESISTQAKYIKKHII